MDSSRQGGRVSRKMLAGVAMVSGAVLSAGCSCAPAREFLGEDTSRRPEVCMVVAPAGLPPGERDDALASVVEQVAAEHGRLTGYVAVSRSAAAFARIELSARANRGQFASPAGNPATRDGEAERWRRVAVQDLGQQLAGAAAAIERDGGLDLLGAIDLCRRSLGDGARRPTIVLVTTGVHNTHDLDLATADAATLAAFSAAVVHAVPMPFHLELRGIGRLDPAATGGPADRALTARLTTAWGGACRELEDRCKSN